MIVLIKRLHLPAKGTEGEGRRGEGGEKGFTPVEIVSIFESVHLLMADLRRAHRFKREYQIGFDNF